ncbi:BTB/POZ domain-containing protein KCTD12 [Schistocerca gregaria]|uniref:BTB/POZ domain-containing protein KCTD12 n=1 Tax=Schistocerca gregaria TaxID=7010 RepID=UPI00211DE69D|nr:BTB/POZ domain-containing protein KCTD12 [Schistocerca gregaria]
MRRAAARVGRPRASARHSQRRGSAVSMQDDSGDCSAAAAAAAAAFPPVLELNVGGVYYTTALSTLTLTPSLLADTFSGRTAVPPRDAKGRYFLDRDGVLFRYVLDFLRNGALVLPDSFREGQRLRQEALHFRLPALADAVTRQKEEDQACAGSGKGRGAPGFITVGYRGSFAFGRDGLADVKFRKLSRILVCGRVALCRDVFGETLNESRDPDHGLSDRYTSRFFLKHSFIEQAFDMLQEHGFKLAGSCGSGTAGGSVADLKPGVDTEENRWNHYNEFVFVRE